MHSMHCPQVLSGCIHSKCWHSTIADGPTCSGSVLITILTLSGEWSSVMTNVRWRACRCKTCAVLPWLLCWATEQHQARTVA